MTPLTLESVELFRIRLPLVAPFETSFGIQSERDILLLKAWTSEGVGWGECVATEEPTYSSEYVEGAQHVLIHHLLPRLFDHGRLSAEHVADILRPVHGHQMAKASIEMALLDAQLRASGESFAHYFGAVRAEVDCGVSVGIHSTIHALLQTVGDYLDQGYRRVKLKTKPSWDVAPCGGVRGGSKAVAFGQGAGGARIRYRGSPRDLGSARAPVRDGAASGLRRRRLPPACGARGRRSR